MSAVDDDITAAMTQDLPPILISSDPRLKKRLAAFASAPAATVRPAESFVAPVAVVKPQAPTPVLKRVPRPKKTQFYYQVANSELELSYFCEVKSKVGEAPVAINSMDFSPDGTILTACTSDDNIAVVDLKLQPVPGKVLNPVKKYGANLIKMLVNHTAVHSSTRTNDDLRLLDLPNHTYIRYFKGHTSEVCSLDVTADGRSIISACAIDRKVLLWDVDRVVPIASLKLGSASIPSLRQWNDFDFGNELPNMKPRSISYPRPVLAFDPTNTVFAVAAREQQEYIRLYDLRNYEKGPFKIWRYGLVDQVFEQFPRNGPVEQRMCAVTAMSADFTDIKFSPDGRLLLLNTNGPYFYIIDARSGKVKRVIMRGHRTYNNSLAANRVPEVSFVPDSEYVIGGNGSTTDPRIYCWSVRSGRLIGILNRDAQPTAGSPNLAMNYVRHNPVDSMIAAAGGARMSLYRIAHCPATDAYDGDVFDDDSVDSSSLYF